MDYPQTDLPALMLVASQNRALCPLDRSAAEITVGSGLDYVAERMAWRIQEGEQSAVSGFMLMASLAKHMPVLAVDNEQRKAKEKVSETQRERAKAKADKARADRDRLSPIFDEAYRWLEERGQRITDYSLSERAFWLAKNEHERKKMTRHYAGVYLKNRLNTL